MVNKEVFKTKTFWGGLTSIVTGLTMIFTTGDIVNGSTQIVIGILAITGRDALITEAKRRQ